MESQRLPTKRHDGSANANTRKGWPHRLPCQLDVLGAVNLPEYPYPGTRISGYHVVSIPLATQPNPTKTCTMRRS
eukprot:3401831-Rhodomonas_salina.1